MFTGLRGHRLCRAPEHSQHQEEALLLSPDPSPSVPASSLACLLRICCSGHFICMDTYNMWSRMSLASFSLMSSRPITRQPWSAPLSPTAEGHSSMCVSHSPWGCWPTGVRAAAVFWLHVLCVSLPGHLSSVPPCVHLSTIVGPHGNSMLSFSRRRRVFSAAAALFCLAASVPCPRPAHGCPSGRGLVPRCAPPHSPVTPSDVHLFPLSSSICNPWRNICSGLLSLVIGFVFLLLSCKSSFCVLETGSVPDR